MKSSSLPALRALGRGGTARSPRGPALKFALRSLQTRLTRRVPWLTTSHVTPVSTSPTRPARLALLIFNPFMPILFLNSRLLGVPSNPYGVTGTLNVDRDDARVNYRRKKLEQPTVQQIQNVKLKPVSLLSYVRCVKSAYGDQNEPNRLAFLRLHFPNATFSSARAMLLLRDTRPASLQPNAKLRKSACLNRR